MTTAGDPLCFPQGYGEQRKPLLQQQLHVQTQQQQFVHQRIMSYIHVGHPFLITQKETALDWIILVSMAYVSINSLFTRLSLI